MQDNQAHEHGNETRTC